ncbi:MAG: phage tail protein [Rhodospirillales bacterium]|jgi:hypothetical protein|nr:phage tail protein [Rhodospirillales bacterium]
MGGSSKAQTVGYRYYVGMHMILCHGPVDAITKVLVGDRVAWSGEATGGQITIDALELFGGESREGGVSGLVDIEMGGPAQTQNSYLAAKLGDVPAFRGVVGVVLRQVYTGMNPYIKAWSFRARRIANLTSGDPQWEPTLAAIGQDMNPAHIIRECLTDTAWGMGYTSADIDNASFLAAAQTMKTEGMGISLLWDRQSAIEDFLREIMRHIDGALFVDRATGRFMLKLVRDDVDEETIITLDETNISRIKDFSRPTLSELTSAVTVIYWDQATGNDASITVQDIALAQTQGGQSGTTIKYPGFTGGGIAAKAATRDLQAVSTPLASCTISATRAAAGLNIGDAFRLDWPDFGADMIMRVTGLAFGGATSNEIKITAVQDVFSIGSAVIMPPQPPIWTDPISDPTASPYRKIYEAPYWDIVMQRGQAEADAMSDYDGAFLIGATSPTDDALSANLWVDVGGVYTQRGTLDFMPTAVLTAAAGHMDTTLAIGSGVDLAAAMVGEYVQIDNELMRVDGVTDTTVTVGRGVLDTVPAAHSSGARLYFTGGFNATDSIVYQDGETVAVKLTTITGKGQLPLASAPIDSLTFDQRAQRPYPPGKFQIGGAYYPASVSAAVDIVVTWAHRDRKQQTTTTLIDTTTGTIGPETGTTYTAILKTSGGTVLATHSGLTGETTTFTLAEIGANTTVRVELYSLRDGLQSLQTHSHTFERA